MKRLVLVFTILSSLLLTGCFSYRDINKVIFVTAVIVDINEDDEYVLTVEGFHSYRSNQTNAEQGEKIFLQSKSKSVYEAARQFNHKASYKVDYTQNKAFIVTERVARRGIKPIMDILERNQELILRSYTLVTTESPQDIVDYEIKQNEYIGLYLDELMENPFLVKQHRLDRVNQYLNYRIMEDRTHILSILQLEKNPVSTNLMAEEGAIMQDDVMVGRLSQSEMKFYRYLQNRIDRALISIPHIEDKEKLISVDTIKNKTKTEIEYDGEKILLKKKIYIRTIFGETQSPLIFTKENIEKVEESVERTIKDNCMALFAKMKEEGFDIFQITELMERKYPNLDLEDPLSITQLQLEVEHQLEGSTNITSFR
ncbi:Ger(x)C family spore germination protein [Alkaliphilus hydrothermalis]|uniref:Ger(X)C family germination protein n=1 Tax=Alkaliphilus hydrothermalis TaxID=1482730 RepID=A0ABS2NQD2_9FIRM|nr:Ger(x)C family spore germination protein [Alkaliphilus hydrothermalis]MBM7614814.1 Ger(x)C family germination protein [Alkaliphilus hydrothermalis]